jgi:hypothetical protein
LKNFGSGILIMWSLFDSFVNVENNSYVLTLLMNDSSMATILALESTDQHRHRILQLIEFTPDKLNASQTWRSTLTQYKLIIDGDKTRRAIHEEIEALNTQSAKTNGRNACPEIQLPDFCSSSTYTISKEQAQTLLAGCISQQRLPLSCNSSFMCAAHQLQNIGLKAPSLDDNDPTSWPDFSFNLFSSKSTPAKASFTLKLMSTPSKKSVCLALFGVLLLVAGAACIGTGLGTSVGVGLLAVGLFAVGVGYKNNLDNCKRLSCLS